MSVIEASLAGAAVLAVAAAWISLRHLIVRLSNNNQLLDEILTTAIAVGFGSGLILITASVVDMADVSSGWVELLALVSLPLVFLLIWRWANVAAKSSAKNFDQELLLTKEIMVAPGAWLKAA